MSTATTTQICITIPTLLGLKLWSLQAYQCTIVAHPNISAAVLLYMSIWPDFPFKLVYNITYAIPKAICLWLLHILGFRREGVGRNTIASRYQARIYGGYVPDDSLFAAYQSYGAIDPGALSYEDEPSVTWSGFLFVFRWTCLVAAIVVFFGQEVDM